ncbi:hypothetical protein D3C75_1315040 [compost metagenome]
MVDLEGRKKAAKAVVVFAEPFQEDIEISYSYEGKLFQKLFSGKLLHRSSLELDLSGGLRYLKVVFPDHPVAVKQIEIYD